MSHDWMDRRLWPLVQHSWKLSNLIFPGSHNSATSTYRGVGPQWGACQKHTVWHQLESGVRFFDLRVADDVDAQRNLWVTHRSPAALLDEVLDDIRSFLDLRQREIVGVRIEKDYDRKLSEAGIEKLDAKLSSCFKGRIIDRDAAKKFTIAELLERGLRVLLCPRSLNLPRTVARHCQVLPSWHATRTDHPSRVISHCSDYLCGAHKSLPKDGATFSMLEAVVTPSKQLVFRNIMSSLSIVSRHIRTQLVSSQGFFDTVVEQSHKHRVCNIISCDFINRSIVERIIDMNLALAEHRLEES